MFATWIAFGQRDFIEDGVKHLFFHVNIPDEVGV
jgi:hypothetical protein